MLNLLASYPYKVLLIIAGYFLAQDDMFAADK